MEVDARRAVVADLAEVAELCRAAIEELRPNRGGAVWSQREARAEPLEAGLGATLDAGLLAVVCIDATVVGYAGVDLVELHDGSVLGQLTDIYVLPDARGVGCGEELIKLAERWCVEQGCIGIDSIALPGDRATKNFFETFGLTARAIRVHRSLRNLRAEPHGM